MAKIHQLFRHLKEIEGSDLHLAATLKPRIRVHGELENVEGWESLSHPELLGMLREITTEKQWRDYESCGDLDFAYGLKGVARFRANYLRQENGAAAVFRIIPEKILTLEQLKLPEAIEGLAHTRQGLVLITGPTGSGKSTTLAAVIDRINDTYEKHIVTIEDPVEFVHPNKKCVLSQREVGTDTTSFAAALKVVVRQDADVVLVGEMRDLETISLAITAAEMGTLVFGTLHTNSAAKTIDRIINVFPTDRQDGVRTVMSSVIRGVLAQQLLRRKEGGRVAAVEVMFSSPALASLIREGKTHQINGYIQQGKTRGMIGMDDSLRGLVEEDIIEGTAALEKALQKDEMRKWLTARGVELPPEQE